MSSKQPRKYCSWCLDTIWLYRKIVRFKNITIDGRQYRLCPMCYYDLELDLMTPAPTLDRRGVDAIRKSRTGKDAFAPNYHGGSPHNLRERLEV